MNTWLEYTDETTNAEGEILYKTKYSVDFCDKHKGDASGYLSKDVFLPDNPILIDEKSYIYSGCEIGENAEIVESKIKKTRIRPGTKIRRSVLNGVSFLFAGKEETEEKKIFVLDSVIECCDEEPLVIFTGTNSDFSAIGSEITKDSSFFGASRSTMGNISINEDALLEIVCSKIEMGKDPITARQNSKIYLDNSAIINKGGKGKAHIATVENGFAYCKKCNIKGEIFCKKIEAYDSDIFGTVVLNENNSASLQKCFIDKNSRICAAKGATIKLKMLELTDFSTIEVLAKKNMSFSCFNTTITERSMIVVVNKMGRYNFLIENSTIHSSTIKDSYISGCKICPNEHCYINCAALTNVGISQKVRIGYDIYDKMCESLFLDIFDIDVYDGYVNIFPIDNKKSIVTIGEDCYFVEDSVYNKFDITEQIQKSMGFLMSNRSKSPLIAETSDIIAIIENSVQKFMSTIGSDCSENVYKIIYASFCYSILSVMNFSNNCRNENMYIEKVLDFENFLSKNKIVDILSKTSKGFSKNAVFVPEWTIQRFENKTNKNNKTKTFIL